MSGPISIFFGVHTVLQIFQTAHGRALVPLICGMMALNMNDVQRPTMLTSECLLTLCCMYTGLPMARCSPWPLPALARS